MELHPLCLNFMLTNLFFCNIRTFSLVNKPLLDKFSPTLAFSSNTWGRSRFILGKENDLIHTYLALQCWDRSGGEYGSVGQVFQRGQPESMPAKALKPLPCPEATGMSTATWQLLWLPSMKAAERQLPPAMPTNVHDREDRQLLEVEMSPCSFGRSPLLSVCQIW